MSTSSYSPVRHMAAALFPSSDRFKFMAMLTAYMDETGHSKDERQRFNGMGGLFGPTEKWIEFETKWKAVLAHKEFRLPYFHMKEFEARHPKTGERVGFYKGRDEHKRRRLFSKLMRLIQNTHSMPVGAVVNMDDYREACPAWEEFIDDPYLFTYQSVIAHTTTFIEVRRLPPDVKVAFIFSNQMEFRHRALKLYEIIFGGGRFTKRSAYEPDFRDMRTIVPLQAADIVAYEMYKEFDRRLYRPTDPVRWGYVEIEKMSRLHQFAYTGRFYTRQDLLDHAAEARAEAARLAYWEKQRTKKATES